VAGSEGGGTNTQGVRGELGPAVAADENGIPAPGAGDCVEAGESGIGVDAVVDEIGGGLGELAPGPQGG
jgi:hypothetical protein